MSSDPDETPWHMRHDETCSGCGTSIPGQGSYCPRCGSLKPSLVRRIELSRETPPDARWQARPSGRYGEGGRRILSWRDIGRCLAAISMVSFAAYLILCLYTLFYGFDIVYPELEGRAFSLYIALIGVSTLLTLTGTALQTWYIFLIAAIVASAIWMLFISARKFGDEVMMKGKARDHSAFFDMCGLMFAILFVNTVIVLILYGIGDNPVDPTETMDLWEMLFLLANASVWEELIVRVLLIGLPLIAFDAAMRGSFKKPQKYVLGGGIPIGWAEVVLILASATIFGFAHYEGWGSWKIFPSALAGVAFGYIFLKHGLAAAILLHFSFDYLSAPLLVFEDSLSLLLLAAIGILLWLGVGFVFLLYFTIRIAEFVTKKTYFDPKEAVEELRPRPLGFGMVHFVCPACGYTGARVLNGRLQCLRCGRLFQ